jgi:hypothetical protein
MQRSSINIPSEEHRLLKAHSKSVPLSKLLIAFIHLYAKNPEFQDMVSDWLDADMVKSIQSQLKRTA